MCSEDGQRMQLQASSTSLFYSLTMVSKLLKKRPHGPYEILLPNNKVIVYWHNVTYSTDVNREAVFAAISHWETHTCIRFHLTDNSAQPHLRFMKGEGCYSYVGLVFQTGQDVSIGEGCTRVSEFVVSAELRKLNKFINGSWVKIQIFRYTATEPCSRADLS